MLEAISWLTNFGKTLYPQIMKTILVIERTRLKLLKFELKLKGHNSRKLHGIWLLNLAKGLS